MSYKTPENALKSNQIYSVVGFVSGVSCGDLFCIWALVVLGDLSRS